MCCYDKNNADFEMQGEIISSFFDGIFNELTNIRQEINSTSLTENNLYSILFRLSGPTRQIYSICRGILLLEPGFQYLTKEMLFLSDVLDEVKRQFYTRGSQEYETPEIDLCLRSSEICATAIGLCYVNPLFCSLARSICLLTKIVCIIIPPLKQ